MARRNFESQGGVGSYAQKNQNRHQKSEQHGRGANSNRTKKAETQNSQKKAFERDSGQHRGYNRERSRETDFQQTRYSGFSGRHTGNYKSRAEETIDDIKQDIIRIEKEIELEIKEIRSLKL